MASVQYNETSLLLSLSLDSSQLTSVDPEWAPLVSSHFASPPVLSSFAALQTAAGQLTEGQGGQPLTEEKTAAIQSTFRSFGIPMGKRLWDGATQGRGPATAALEGKGTGTGMAQGPADAPTEPSASTAAAEGKAAGEEEEEKRSMASTAASASGASSPSVVYAPTSGFLSTLTRHLSRLTSSLAHNAAPWTGRANAAVATAGQSGQETQD